MNGDLYVNANIKGIDGDESGVKPPDTVLRGGDSHPRVELPTLADNPPTIPLDDSPPAAVVIAPCECCGETPGPAGVFEASINGVLQHRYCFECYIRGIDWAVKEARRNL